MEERKKSRWPIGMKLIALAVIQAFLATQANISWAAPRPEQAQYKIFDAARQQNRKVVDAANEHADVQKPRVDERLASAQPLIIAVPGAGVVGEFAGLRGRRHHKKDTSPAENTVRGLVIAGEQLPAILGYLQKSGVSVSEAGILALREGFSRADVQQGLAVAGYDSAQIEHFFGTLAAWEKPAQQQPAGALNANHFGRYRRHFVDQPAAAQRTLPVDTDELDTGGLADLRAAGVSETDLFAAMQRDGFSPSETVHAMHRSGFSAQRIVGAGWKKHQQAGGLLAAAFGAAVKVSSEELYASLANSGRSDAEIIAAFKKAGASAEEVLKVSSGLDRDMIAVATGMLDAGFSAVEVVNAFVAKGLNWAKDQVVNAVNCAVFAVESFLAKLGISSEKTGTAMAYDLMLQDILAGGEVSIKNGGVMTSAQAIVKVAQALGIDLSGCVLSFEQLASAGPAIAHVGGNHWVTVENIENDTVTLIDNGARKQISRAEFMQSWRGVALVAGNVAQDKNFESVSAEQMLQTRGAGLLDALIAKADLNKNVQESTTALTNLSASQLRREENRLKTLEKRADRLEAQQAKLEEKLSTATGARATALSKQLDRLEANQDKIQEKIVAQEAVVSSFVNPKTTPTQAPTPAAANVAAPAPAMPAHVEEAALGAQQITAPRSAKEVTTTTQVSTPTVTATDGTVVNVSSANQTTVTTKRGKTEYGSVVTTVYNGTGTAADGTTANYTVTVVQSHNGNKQVTGKTETTTVQAAGAPVTYTVKEGYNTSGQLTGRVVTSNDTNTNTSSKTFDMYNSSGQFVFKTAETSTVAQTQLKLAADGSVSPTAAGDGVAATCTTTLAKYYDATGNLLMESTTATAQTSDNSLKHKTVVYESRTAAGALAEQGNMSESVNSTGTIIGKTIVDTFDTDGKLASRTTTDSTKTAAATNSTVLTESFNAAGEKTGAVRDTTVAEVTALTTANAPDFLKPHVANAAQPVTVTTTTVTHYVLDASGNVTGKETTVYLTGEIVEKTRTSTRTGDLNRAGVTQTSLTEKEQKKKAKKEAELAKKGVDTSLRMSATYNETVTFTFAVVERLDSDDHLTSRTTTTQTVTAVQWSGTFEDTKKLVAKPKDKTTHSAGGTYNIYQKEETTDTFSYDDQGNMLPDVNRTVKSALFYDFPGGSVTRDGARDVYTDKMIYLALPHTPSAAGEVFEQNVTQHSVIHMTETTVAGAGSVAAFIAGGVGKNDASSVVKVSEALVAIAANPAQKQQIVVNLAAALGVDAAKLTASIDQTVATLASSASTAASPVAQTVGRHINKTDAASIEKIHAAIVMMVATPAKRQEFITNLAAGLSVDATALANAFDQAVIGTLASVNSAAESIAKAVGEKISKSDAASLDTIKTAVQQIINTPAEKQQRLTTLAASLGVEATVLVSAFDPAALGAVHSVSMTRAIVPLATFISTEIQKTDAESVGKIEAAMWSLIIQPQNKQSIVTDLAAKVGVDAAVVSAAVERMLNPAVIAASSKLPSLAASISTILNKTDSLSVAKISAAVVAITAKPEQRQQIYSSLATDLGIDDTAVTSAVEQVVFSAASGAGADAVASVAAHIGSQVQKTDTASVEKIKTAVTQLTANPGQKQQIFSTLATDLGVDAAALSPVIVNALSGLAAAGASITMAYKQNAVLSSQTTASYTQKVFTFEPAGKRKKNDILLGNSYGNIRLRAATETGTYTGTYEVVQSNGAGQPVEFRSVEKYTGKRTTDLSAWTPQELKKYNKLLAKGKIDPIDKAYNDQANYTITTHSHDMQYNARGSLVHSVVDKIDSRASMNTTTTTLDIEYDANGVMTSQRTITREHGKLDDLFGDRQSAQVTITLTGGGVIRIVDAGGKVLDASARVSFNQKGKYIKTGNSVVDALFVKQGPQQTATTLSGPRTMTVTLHRGDRIQVLGGNPQSLTVMLDGQSVTFNRNSMGAFGNPVTVETKRSMPNTWEVGVWRDHTITEVQSNFQTDDLGRTISYVTTVNDSASPLLTTQTQRIFNYTDSSMLASSYTDITHGYGYDPHGNSGLVGDSGKKNSDKKNLKYDTAPAVPAGTPLTLNYTSVNQLQNIRYDSAGRMIYAAQYETARFTPPQNFLITSASSVLATNAPRQTGELFWRYDPLPGSRLVTSATMNLQGTIVNRSTYSGERLISLEAGRESMVSITYNDFGQMQSYRSPQFTKHFRAAEGTQFGLALASFHRPKLDEGAKLAYDQHDRMIATYIKYGPGSVLAPEGHGTYSTYDVVYNGFGLVREQKNGFFNYTEKTEDGGGGVLCKTEITTKTWTWDVTQQGMIYNSLGLLEKTIEKQLYHDQKVVVEVKQSGFLASAVGRIIWTVFKTIASIVLSMIPGVGIFLAAAFNMLTSYLETGSFMSALISGAISLVGGFLGGGDFGLGSLGEGVGNFLGGISDTISGGLNAFWGAIGVSAASPFLNSTVGEFLNKMVIDGVVSMVAGGIESAINGNFDIGNVLINGLVSAGMSGLGQVGNYMMGNMLKPAETNSAQQLANQPQPSSGSATTGTAPSASTSSSASWTDRVASTFSSAWETGALQQRLINGAVRAGIGAGVSEIGRATGLDQNMFGRALVSGVSSLAQDFASAGVGWLSYNTGMIGTNPATNQRYTQQQLSSYFPKWAEGGAGLNLYDPARNAFNITGVGGVLQNAAVSAGTSLIVDGLGTLAGAAIGDKHRYWENQSSFIRNQWSTNAASFLNGAAMGIRALGNVSYFQNLNTLAPADVAASLQASIDADPFSYQAMKAQILLPQVNQGISLAAAQGVNDYRFVMTNQDIYNLYFNNATTFQLQSQSVPSATLTNYTQFTGTAANGATTYNSYWGNAAGGATWQSLVQGTDNQLYLVNQNQLATGQLGLRTVFDYQRGNMVYSSATNQWTPSSTITAAQLTSQNTMLNQQLVNNQQLLQQGGQAMRVDVYEFGAGGALNWLGYNTGVLPANFQAQQNVLEFQGVLNVTPMTTGAVAAAANTVELPTLLNPYTGGIRYDNTVNQSYWKEGMQFNVGSRPYTYTLYNTNPNINNPQLTAVAVDHWTAGNLTLLNSQGLSGILDNTTLFRGLNGGVFAMQGGQQLSNASPLTGTRFTATDGRVLYIMDGPAQQVQMFTSADGSSYLQLVQGDFGLLQGGSMSLNRNITAPEIMQRNDPNPGDAQQPSGSRVMNTIIVTTDTDGNTVLNAPNAAEQPVTLIHWNESQGGWVVGERDGLWNRTQQTMNINGVSLDVNQAGAFYQNNFWKLNDGPDVHITAGTPVILMNITDGNDTVYRAQVLLSNDIHGQDRIVQIGDTDVLKVGFFAEAQDAGGSSIVTQVGGRAAATAVFDQGVTVRVENDNWKFNGGAHGQMFVFTPKSDSDSNAPGSRSVYRVMGQGSIAGKGDWMLVSTDGISVQGRTGLLDFTDDTMPNLTGAGAIRGDRIVVPSRIDAAIPDTNAPATLIVNKQTGQIWQYRESRGNGKWDVVDTQGSVKIQGYLSQAVNQDNFINDVVAQRIDVNGTIKLQNGSLAFLGGGDGALYVKKGSNETSAAGPSESIWYNALPNNGTVKAKDGSEYILASTRGVLFDQVGNRYTGNFHFDGNGFMPNLYGAGAIIGELMFKSGTTTDTLNDMSNNAFVHTRQITSDGNIISFQRMQDINGKVQAVPFAFQQPNNVTVQHFYTPQASAFSADEVLPTGSLTVNNARFSWQQDEQGWYIGMTGQTSGNGGLWQAQTRGSGGSVPASNSFYFNQAQFNTTDNAGNIWNYYSVDGLQHNVPTADGTTIQRQSVFDFTGDRNSLNSPNLSGFGALRGTILENGATIFKAQNPNTPFVTQSVTFDMPAGVSAIHYEQMGAQGWQGLGLYLPDGATATSIDGVGGAFRTQILPQLTMSPDRFIAQPSTVKVLTQSFSNGTLQANDVGQLALDAFATGWHATPLIPGNAEKNPGPSMSAYVKGDVITDASGVNWQLYNGAEQWTLTNGEVVRGQFDYDGTSLFDPNLDGQGALMGSYLKNGDLWKLSSPQENIVRQLEINHLGPDEQLILFSQSQGYKNGELQQTIYGLSGNNQLAGSFYRTANADGINATAVFLPETTLTIVNTPEGRKLVLAGSAQGQLWESLQQVQQSGANGAASSVKEQQSPSARGTNLTMITDRSGARLWEGTVKFNLDSDLPNIRGTDAQLSYTTADGQTLTETVGRGYTLNGQALSEGQKIKVWDTVLKDTATGKFNGVGSAQTEYVVKSVSGQLLPLHFDAQKTQSGQMSATATGVALVLADAATRGRCIDGITSTYEGTAAYLGKTGVLMQAPNGDKIVLVNGQNLFSGADPSNLQLRSALAVVTQTGFKTGQGNMFTILGGQGEGKGSASYESSVYITADDKLAYNPNTFMMINNGMAVLPDGWKVRNTGAKSLNILHADGATTTALAQNSAATVEQGAIKLFAERKAVNALQNQLDPSKLSGDTITLEFTDGSTITMPKAAWEGGNGFGQGFADRLQASGEGNVITQAISAFNRLVGSETVQLYDSATGQRREVSVLSGETGLLALLRSLPQQAVQDGSIIAPVKRDNGTVENIRIPITALMSADVADLYRNTHSVTDETGNAVAFIPEDAYGTYVGIRNDNGVINPDTPVMNTVRSAMEWADAHNDLMSAAAVVVVPLAAVVGLSGSVGGFLASAATTFARDAAIYAGILGSAEIIGAIKDGASFGETLSRVGSVVDDALYYAALTVPLSGIASGLGILAQAVSAGRKAVPVARALADSTPGVWSAIKAVGGEGFSRVFPHIATAASKSDKILSTGGLVSVGAGVAKSALSLGVRTAQTMAHLSKFTVDMDAAGTLAGAVSALWGLDKPLASDAGSFKKLGAWALNALAKSADGDLVDKIAGTTNVKNAAIMAALMPGASKLTGWMTGKIGNLADSTLFIPLVNQASGMVRSAAGVFNSGLAGGAMFSSMGALQAWDEGKSGAEILTAATDGLAAGF
ncbi:MAG: cysteine peptidase family C39 domain-containing protein, partial [Candidatus Omnitrophica bacterium]|nr:cysteine peptidase family C39 domain-containing protein [Candidatus Omnitrophota bacterium]